MIELVGRQAEARLVVSNAETKRHTLLIGESGLGKSALLNFLQPVLEEVSRVVWCSRVGPGFATFLKEVYSGLWELGLVEKETGNLEADLDTWTKAKKTNDAKAKHIVEVLGKADNVLLVIDDIGNITPSSRPWLEAFSEKATMLGACEESALAKKNTKRFWKRFDEVKIGPLAEKESRELLAAFVSKYQIHADDMEIYTRKVLTLAQGSPYELERLCKYYSAQDLVKVNEINAHQQRLVDQDRRQLALMPFIIMLGGCLVAGRFVARARSDMDLYVIAGVSFVFFMLFLPWLRRSLKPRTS